ncbi:hypothetical protein BDQ17DRAFT_434014 [Cyathus striatus]|nr:hypothetical protein BDQ17DRAFT_434014 [Cyathus striatus]
MNQNGKGHENASVNAKKGHAHVVIVGAGLAGITAGIQLKRKLGFNNFTIYERADAVGGTWRDNTYPGCGSDVPAHWYSLSTDLEPNFSRHYASQPELQNYWEKLWHNYDLVKHTRLSCNVTHAVWDAKEQRYHVTIKNRKTGEEEHTDAEVMFWAVGGFQDPLYPEHLVGSLDKFKGTLFHSARWRHDVDLKGKRVGVIGNGCSAAQFVPLISKDSSVEVINFCRTPQWYAKQGNFAYPGWLKWVFAHIPFVLRWYRNMIMARMDVNFLIFRKANERLLRITRKMLESYIKSKAPKELVEQLIPKYTPGCKRIILDPGYLECLHQANVSLQWDGIADIVEEGLKMKTGEVVPLDVMIFGTGYSLVAPDMRVTGSSGETIYDYFERQGGATAYLGMCMPGFPNLFTILGPNVATGHGSAIFSEEAQINYGLQVIKPIIDGEAGWFEVTEEATERYNEWLQKRLSTSVWTDCRSFYRAEREKETKIIATFPGPVSLFWWLTLWPRWGDFKWDERGGGRGVRVGVVSWLFGVVSIVVLYIV